MPKPKQFLKDNKKKSKHAPKAPETADEYLAAGVDLEEAGEKWRGGDAVKSTRFFVRAIDCYNEGLKKFPDSFDLAYNKARVQYELTQHPKLKDQLPGSLLDLLKTALESSRYALALKEDNADILFNTAQILDSLAEAINETRDGTMDPLPLLEESLELFTRCLALQEYRRTENTAEEAEAMEESTQEDPSSIPNSEVDASSPVMEEQWATIIEPITNDTLLDTVIAQLHVLTQICSAIPSQSSKLLSFVDEYSRDLLNIRLPTYLINTNRDLEAGLSRANLLVAYADANFRFSRIDPFTYATQLTDAFTPIDLQKDAPGLVTQAEALIAFDSSVRNANQSQGQHRDLSTGDLRWKALTQAQKCLTSASSLPDTPGEEKAKIYLLRGDVELARYQMGAREGYKDAVTYAGTLLDNAGKFYRGATALAKNAGSQEESDEARVKETVVSGFKGQKDILEFWKTEREAVGRVLEEAVEDGLVSEIELHGMGLQ